MRRGFVKYSLVIVVIILCFSCKKAEEENLYPLAVSSEVDQLKSGAGDGVVKTTNDNIINNPMGVYGKYNDVSLGTSGGTNVFASSEAQEVTYDKTEKKWTYSPVQNWRINKYYRFRAFHPYGGSAISLNASSDVDNLVLGYSVASGHDDLLVGFRAVTATTDVITKPVKFNFVHALSGLQFEMAFKNIAEIEDSYTDYLTEFYLTGLVATGTMNYTHADGDLVTPELNWYALAYDNSSVFYHWTADTGTDGKLISKLNDDRSNAVMVFDGDSHLVYAIPQSRSASDKPTYVYFKTKNSGSDVQSAKLPDVKWEPGKIYKYTLLINASSVEINITIKDWNTVSSNNNIYL